MEERFYSGAWREDIYEYAQSQYGSCPEHPWASLPLYAVLRRPDNRKWYALIMNIPQSKLGLSGDGRVDILDIKCNPCLRNILSVKNGFFPAYHLNRDNWITVILDGTVDKEMLFGLLDESYEIAKGKQKKTVRRNPTSWLVPVNPKFYDIIKAFGENDTVLWKQSASVIVGDTVYLYLTAPYSCVMYKCEAVETDIPYDYDDGNVHMRQVMKIKRLFAYDKDVFGLAELKKHGVVTVRGPRKIPFGLRNKLEYASEENERIE